MSTRPDSRKGRRPRQERKDFSSRPTYHEPPPRFANRRNFHDNYDPGKASVNHGSSNQSGGENGFSPRKDRDRQMNYGTRSYSNKMYGNGAQIVNVVYVLPSYLCRRRPIATVAGQVGEPQHGAVLSYCAASIELLGANRK